MAAVGVHVELTVRLGRVVEGFHSASACRFGCCTCYVKLRTALALVMTDRSDAILVVVADMEVVHVNASAAAHT